MGTALKYHCDELYYNSKAINKLQKMLTTIKAKPKPYIYMCGCVCHFLNNTRENVSPKARPENDLCNLQRP